jgi:hypothetical protein
VFGNGLLTSLQVTFHIDSDTATIDGRKFLDVPSTAAGGCNESFGGVFAHVGGGVRYEAIIKPLTGGSYADEGTSSLSVAMGAPAEDIDTSVGFVTEQFASTLAETRPLLPTAKDQCKDQGFLIFGVFENQGDCVSFVTTYGKNEPGKNQP